MFLGEQAVVKVYLADTQKQYVTPLNQQFPIARNKFALHLSTQKPGTSLNKLKQIQFLQQPSSTYTPW